MYVHIPFASLLTRPNYQLPWEGGGVGVGYSRNTYRHKATTILLKTLTAE